jgi:hypothetical protein
VNNKSNQNQKINRKNRQRTLQQKYRSVSRKEKEKAKKNKKRKKSKSRNPTQNQKQRAKKMVNSTPRKIIKMINKFWIKRKIFFPGKSIKHQIKMMELELFIQVYLRKVLIARLLKNIVYSMDC